MEKTKVRIEELEREKFYLSMKDHWSYEDYNHNHKLFVEIQKLKAELEK